MLLRQLAINVLGFGIYHLVPMGASNRYEMAQTLIAAERRRETSNKSKQIHPIFRLLVNQLLKPPEFLLNNEKLSEWLSFALPDWEEDFLQVADQILQDFV